MEVLARDAATGQHAGSTCESNASNASKAASAGGALSAAAFPGILLSLLQLSSFTTALFTTAL